MNTVAIAPTRPTGVPTAEGATLYTRVRLYQMQNELAAQYTDEFTLSFADPWSGGVEAYTFTLDGTLHRPLVRVYTPSSISLFKVCFL